MSAQALFTEAAGLHRQGKLAEAERLYLELLRVDPWSVSGRHLFGVLRSQQGRNDEAIELIAGALQSNPKDFGALLNYGLVLQRCGRVDEALKAYDRALTLKPDFVEAHFNRGVLLLERKRFERRSPPSARRWRSGPITPMPITIAPWRSRSCGASRKR